MESGPAAFAGTAFLLCGAALLSWTAVRLRHRAPVAHGVNSVAAATLSLLFGAAAFGGGIWCLSHL
ncbi:hypothetical protein RKE29_00635 [Streptomyces sp. B1866]|uniref:hypothetical protein n=1 Tax=Streptomyces sp. B1866 TaxID=3075431 RepID=UPI00288E840F|nr:hypothetical protein [Streptomyces sp. B1866]MDT3395173.1 hypothetical protein [Streptomyces sp. B1866]